LTARCNFKLLQGFFCFRFWCAPC